MKVYVIEDHTVMIEGYKVFLKTIGHVLVGFSTTARNILDEIKSKDIDVILLDISLENENGLDFLKVLQEEKITIPVIVCSAYSSPVFVRHAIKDGVAGYILKDELENVLHIALPMVNRGKKYFSPKIKDAVVEAQLNKGKEVKFSEIISPRENEVLQSMLRNNTTSREIATELNIAPSTVRNLLARIYQKLKVKSPLELFKLAAKYGYLKKDE